MLLLFKKKIFCRVLLISMCFIICIAREASKRIVEDLLLTAGGNVTDDLDEDSPSVVRRVGVEEEDTF